MSLQNNTGRKQSIIVTAFVFLFTLFSVLFFDPVFLNDQKLPTYIYAALNIFLLPYVVYYYFKRNSDYMFMGAMKLINIATLISVFCSYYFWNQPLRDAFIAVLFPLAGYNLYFYLIRKNVSAATIEGIIYIVGIAAVGAFFISFVLYPRQIFNNVFDSETGEFERGVQRIQLTGFGFIYLFFFMSLNKIFSNRKRMMKWVLLCAISYVCIVLSLTRTYIVFSTVIGLIYLFRNSNFFIKALIAGGIITGAVIIPNLTYVQNMVQLTKEDIGKNKEYVRIQAAEYFLNDFQRSPMTRVLGNGIAYGENEYGRHMENVNKIQGFYVEDLGLIGLYIYMGLLGVIAYVIIFYKGFREKLSDEFRYLKMFVAFLLFIGLNSYATYNASFIACIVFVLYLYEVDRSNRAEEEESDEWDIGQV